MKKYIWAVVLIAVGAVLVMAMPDKTPIKEVESDKQVGLADSPANARYTFGDGKDEFTLNVTLTDGVSVITDEPEAGVEITTRLFGEPVMGDLDADGDMDAGVILQQESGGTGTFYYVAAAVNKGTGYLGTNVIFLGDRIAPQTVEIKDGMLIANYADRAFDEPFSATPTIGKSLYARLEGMELEEVTSE